MCIRDRYRTEPIRIHELTYLFVVIGIAILNAVVSDATRLGEVLLVNSVIAGTTAVLEYCPWFRANSRLRITYDDLDRIRSGDPAGLLADLTERTGLDIDRYSIDGIDLLRETARITIHYRR